MKLRLEYHRTLCLLISNSLSAPLVWELKREASLSRVLEMSEMLNALPRALKNLLSLFQRRTCASRMTVSGPPAEDRAISDTRCWAHGDPLQQGAQPLLYAGYCPHASQSMLVSLPSLQQSNCSLLLSMLAVCRSALAKWVRLFSEQYLLSISRASSRGWNSSWR